MTTLLPALEADGEMVIVNSTLDEGLIRHIPISSNYRL